MANHQEQPLSRDVDTLQAEIRELRSRLADAHAICQERNRLRSSMEESREHIEVALHQLSRCQVNEKMALNTASRLEARLEEANAQKLDVLEHNYQLQEAVRDRERTIQELHAERAALRTACGGTGDARMHKADNPQQQGLDAVHAALVDESRAAASRIEELESRLTEAETRAKVLQTEKDRVTAVLHGEIRRQTLRTNQEYPVSSTLSAKTDLAASIAAVRARVHELLAQAAEGAGDGMPYRTEADPATRIAQLEKEIDYHLQDIVLYKLDVKGYRKDLRRANAKIQKLQQRLGTGGRAAECSSIPSIGSASTATTTPPAADRRESPTRVADQTDPAGFGLGLGLSISTSHEPTAITHGYDGPAVPDGEVTSQPRSYPFPQFPRPPTSTAPAHHHPPPVAGHNAKRAFRPVTPPVASSFLAFAARSPVPSPLARPGSRGSHQSNRSVGGEDGGDGGRPHASSLGGGDKRGVADGREREGQVVGRSRRSLSTADLEGVGSAGGAVVANGRGGDGHPGPSVWETVMGLRGRGNG